MLAKKDKNEKIIPITKYFKAGFDESVDVISQVGNLIAIGDTRKSDVITSTFFQIFCPLKIKFSYIYTLLASR